MHSTWIYSGHAAVSRQLTWTGSSPWTARPAVLPSVLFEAVSAQERCHNGPSYCPSLRKPTLDTWNLECCPAETVWKNIFKKTQTIRKTLRGQSSKLWNSPVNRLTRAVRSCSCSYPAHSPPSSSQSGSGAAPIREGSYRHNDHLLEIQSCSLKLKNSNSPPEKNPHKLGESQQTIPHLLMVRLLNQLLGVIQFSYQSILRRDGKKLTRWQIKASNHAPWHIMSLPTNQEIKTPLTHFCIIHLILQSRHPLFEVKLQPLVGLWKELVHRLRQTLVVLLIHLLSLPCLY